VLRAWSLSVRRGRRAKPRLLYCQDEGRPPFAVNLRGGADLRHSPQGFRAVAVRPTQSDEGVHAPLRCFASSGGFFHECPQASCSAALLRPCPVVSGFERRAEWAWGHLVSHQYGCIHPKTRRSSSKPTTAPMSSRMTDRSGRPPTLARTGSAGTEGAGFMGNGTEGVGARVASAAPSAAL
jgi:hypothetical protein